MHVAKQEIDAPKDEGRSPRGGATTSGKSSIMTDVDIQP